MSKLSQISINKKKKNVKMGDIEIEIKPLSSDYIPLFLAMQDESGREEGKILKEIIDATLKDAVPDATDEEIKNVSVEHLQPLMEAIMEVNSLGKENKDKQELINKIKDGRINQPGNKKA